MLPQPYERWLDRLSRGEEEAPIAPIEYQRLGVERRLEYISGLGFSEHLTETVKEQLLEDDDFARAIYHLIDGSADLGREKAVVAISNAAKSVITEAADALFDALDNLPEER